MQEQNTSLVTRPVYNASSDLYESYINLNEVGSYRIWVAVTKEFSTNAIVPSDNVINGFS